MSFAGCQLEQLTDLFQEHLLQYLPAISLARLRASCGTFKSLVDSGALSSATQSVPCNDKIPQNQYTDPKLKWHF